VEGGTLAMADSGLAASTPRPGVSFWTNERNRLSIYRLHYSADPYKRGDWAEGKALRAQAGERAFKREYEIDWASPEGEPVIPGFNPLTHVRPVTVDPKRKLLRFWDFGFVSPVVLFAQLNDYGQLRIFRELCPFNTPLDALIEFTLAMTRDLVLDVKNVFDAGDPAAKSQTDLGNAAEVCNRAGITLHTSRPGTDVSYAGLHALMLKRLWCGRDGEQAAFVVDPICKRLIAALSGAFHLSTYAPYKPVREHPHTDLVDALRYGHDNLGSANRDFRQQLMALATNDIVPSYSTTQGAFR
jgi:hypothetical protein